MRCAAHLDGDHCVLDGEKTWISNGGIADMYVVFARSAEDVGGLGVGSEQPVERLYRDIRALRIYAGATEVQQLIIARAVEGNQAVKRPAEAGR
jgi:alkylation response protein AidB-like acyl-CoA dehydrogenase